MVVIAARPFLHRWPSYSQSSHPLLHIEALGLFDFAFSLAAAFGALAVWHLAKLPGC